MTDVQNRPRSFGKSTLVTNQFLVSAKLGESAIYNHPEYVCLTNKAFEQRLNAERTKLLAEVEGWLVDEDIDIVHHFYSCRVSSEHRCPQCKKTGCEAYVYSGGMVNGRNSLRAELRAKLQEMKGKTV